MVKNGDSRDRLSGLKSCCCCYYCLIAKSCLILCNPMNCIMPGFRVLHYLPEFAHTYVQFVDDAIQLCHPFSCLQSSPVSGSFSNSRLFASGGQSIGTSASVLSLNIQDWFSLGLTGLIFLQFKGVSRVFSNSQFKRFNSSVHSLLYGPAFTSLHDYWKNHSFDYIDLCHLA